MHTLPNVDDPKSPAPQRPVDSLALFSMGMAVYGVFVFAANISGDLMGFWAALPFALGLLLWPRSTPLLVIFMAWFVGYYLWRAPVRSNNQTVAFFTCLTCLVVGLGGRLSRPEALTRRSLFAAFSGPARIVLVALYFYGIFHKINTDFLDPQVSCASVLYDQLARWVALDHWTPGYYVAIYSTFVFEGAAMLLLLSRRYKMWGFAIGLPFHIIIGFTGYSFYMDFSTLAVALYLLQIPEEVADAINTRILARRPARAHPDGFWPHYRLFMIKAVVILGALVGGVIALGGGKVRAMMIPFFAYSAVVYLGVLWLAWKHPWQPLMGSPRWAWAWGVWVPLLFVLNGMSPYLGFKTESSIAMFSNLHTEGGVTNHLIVTHPIDAFGYLGDLFTVTGADNPRIARRYAQKEITRYELDRLRAQGVQLTAVPSSRRSSPEGPALSTNTFSETPWLARKFLVFKPVDWARPKICSH
ncbi:MAG: hypothetical protein ACE366_00610 [Bradymonadia bacterium]